MSGTFQHVDQAEGFGAVNLMVVSPVLHPGTFLGGPLTQSTFTFNPELPAEEHDQGTCSSSSSIRSCQS